MLLLCYISLILHTFVGASHLTHKNDFVNQSSLTKDWDVCAPRSIKTPWITHIVTWALEGYIPSGETESDLCTQQGLIYASHLSNLTLWATKMYDASSRGNSPGLIEGRNFDFGHFHECVSASSEKHGIYGKYVMVKLEFAPYRAVYPGFYRKNKVYTPPTPDDSAWDAIKPTYDRRITQRNMLNWAICVPSACTDSNIQTSLSKRLYPALEMNQIQGNITIQTHFSYSRATNRAPGSSFYVFLGVMGVLIAIISLSTFYDLNKQENEKETESWYLLFSVRKNWDKLFTIKKNEFSAISGMKVLSMFIVVFGHRLFYMVSFPQYSPNSSELSIGTYWNTKVYNGAIIINTFMTITGFLTFYKIICNIDSKKPHSMMLTILSRYLRLTPAYLFIMAIMYYSLNFVEGGPLTRFAWDANFGTYWWTHITYLNNYIKPEFQNLIPSWYIAFDMQMYVFCCFMGAVAKRVRKFTLPLLILASLVFLLLPAIRIAHTNYYGAYLFYHMRLANHFLIQEFQDMYLPTHIRASSYIIGMLGGYIYHEIKEKKITISTKTLWAGSVVAGVFMHFGFTLSYLFYIPGREYVLWENMAYAVFHRIGWASSICWIIIATAVGKFGPFCYTIGLNFFEPLNKLTYCVLLVHTLIQTHLFGYITEPVQYDNIVGLWMSCGDIVFTYIASVIVYCLVEAPFSNLQNKIMDNYMLKSNIKCSKDKCK